MSLCGYRKLQMDRARSHWLIRVTRACTEWADQGSERCRVPINRARGPIYRGAFLSIAKWVCIAWYSVAKLVCLLFANIVNLLWQAVTYVVWLPCRLLFPDRKKPDRIQHVFVVMLENRAFDHMSGLSNIHGTDAISGQPTTIDGLNESNNWNLDPNGNKVYASAPADWAMPYDPGHEFPDVKEQLCGAGGEYPHINNSGFVTNYSHFDHDNPAEIMKCYSADQLPVLTTLAREFAVCDRWYSSMPGPTWPNRFFVHAASSGGLDHSPTKLDMASSLLYNGYKFDNGTIYASLDDEDIAWTIYHGDEFPQALAISGMHLKLLEGRFKNFKDFASDVSDPGYSTSYVFIEPNYGHVLTQGGNFKCGNSQHPLDDVTRGERLLKDIYEIIRNSPHWESSVLIIMYDEHGGFYDHVAPPEAVAPGDSITDPENNIYNFDFKRLGVRVPAVIVSPLIPKATIDHTVYDHTSVLATIENIFGLPPLTERDKHANTFKHLLSLATPRMDAPTTLPEPADSGIKCDEEEVSAASTALAAHAADATAPVDTSLQGFVNVAFLRDLHASSPEEKENLAAKYQNINTRLEAKQYMREVRRKIK
jgi:phospholipase C